MNQPLSQASIKAIMEDLRRPSRNTAVKKLKKAGIVVWNKYDLVGC